MKKLRLLLFICQMLSVSIAYGQYSYDYTLNRSTVDTVQTGDTIIVSVDSILIQNDVSRFSIDFITTTTVAATLTGRYYNLGTFSICVDDELTNLIRNENTLDTIMSPFRYHFYTFTSVDNIRVGKRYVRIGTANYLVLRYILRLGTPATETFLWRKSTLFTGTYQ